MGMNTYLKINITMDQDMFFLTIISATSLALSEQYDKIISFLFRHKMFRKGAFIFFHIYLEAVSNII